MTVKKKVVPEPYTGPIWPLGTRVRLLRPNLWAGLEGEVKAVDEKRGVHRVLVKRNAPLPMPPVVGFDAQALGTELQPI